MSTSITLTNIEEMKHSDVVMALEFIAKKIGFDQSVPAPATKEDRHVDPDPAPQLPEVPVASGIDVDASGLPWDGRIHASTRSKTQDGNWKMRRGVDDDIVSAVLNELRQTMGMAPTEVVPPTPLTPPPAQVFAQPEHRCHHPLLHLLSRPLLPQRLRCLRRSPRLVLRLVHPLLSRLLFLS